MILYLETIVVFDVFYEYLLLTQAPTYSKFQIKELLFYFVISNGKRPHYLSLLKYQIVEDQHEFDPESQSPKGNKSHLLALNLVIVLWF